MIVDESKEVVQETRKKEQESKTLKKVATLRPQKGHTLFKVNKETLEISKAEFEQVEITFGEARDGKKPRKKVITEDGFFYITALNVKNVKKKLIKIGVAVEVK